jgi:hypothetical protein
MKAVALLAAALFAAFDACGGVLDILGPRDRPDFQAMDWTAITVRYGVNTRASNGIQRTFTITNHVMIAGLKAAMTVKKVQGISVGTREQLQFVDRRGQSWHGHLAGPSRLDLSSTADRGRAYALEFPDAAFVDALLDQCVANERAIYPKARRENILLVEQFLLEPWPDAPPDSARWRKDRLESYPAVEEGEHGP